MDDVIRQIVEIDGGLRARVAECEARLARMRDEDAAAEAGEPAAQSHAQCEAEQILRQAREGATAAARRLEARYAEEEQALRETYAQKREAWVKALFERCIRPAGDGE